MLLVGNDGVLTANLNFSNGRAYRTTSGYVAVESGVAKRIFVFTQNQNAPGITIALYDSGGNLLAATPAITPVAATWVSAAIPDVAIAEGVQYFLVGRANSYQQVGYTGSASHQQWNGGSLPAFPDWPATLPGQDGAGTTGVFCMYVDGDAATQNPVIDSITPTRNGEAFTITGTNFGAVQGTVSIAGVAQNIGAWEDTAVLCTCARGTLKYGTYDLVLTPDGAATATAPTDLLPQTGYDYTNLVGPLAPTVQRITATADLADGDQLAYSKAAQVEVYPDASFVCDADTGTFSVEANDGTGWGTAGTQTVAEAVSTPPTITTVSLGTLQIGVAYSLQLVATGDVPITWTRYAGTIPAGLTLSAAGLLSGTPTGSGAAYNFTVEATNAHGSDTQVYTGNVNQLPLITTTTLGPLRVGVSFNETLAASGFPAPTFSTVAGTIPAGLTLSAAGLVSGTPTTAGAYNFTARATNAAGTDDQIYSGTVSIAFAVPVITTTVLPVMSTNVPYDQQIEATGNPAPTFALQSGTLPTGLVLESSGRLHGTPTVSAAYSFTVRATNSQGFDDQLFTGSVSAALAAPIITTTNLNPMFVGVAFNQQIDASGNPAPTFAVSAGTLPAGLALSSAGVLSGTPTATGAYNFTVTATNSQGSDPQAYTGTVLAAPSIPDGLSINDYMMAVIARDVGAGHTLNDGLLAYFKLRPAVTATTLQQAEQQWLADQLPVSDGVIDDLWYYFLFGLGYNGTNDDMKLWYWRDLAQGTGVSVLTRDYTAVWAQFAASAVGYRLSPAGGSISPDNLFAGGSIAQIASTSEDIVYVLPVGGVQFPNILPGFLWVSTIPAEGGIVAMKWDIDRYVAHVEDIYSLMQGNIGLPVRVRISGDV